MNHEKLTKEELIKLCKERKLSFSSSWRKEKIKDLLIKNDKYNQKTKSLIKDNKTGKIGSIINIVFSSIFLLFSFLLITIISMSSLSITNDINNQLSSNYLIGGALDILMGGIIWTYIGILVLWAIGLLFTIVSNVKYKNSKKNKKMAGILGIIFSGIIGGIMVLMGE